MTLGRTLIIAAFALALCKATSAYGEPPTCETGSSANGIGVVVYGTCAGSETDDGVPTGAVQPVPVTKTILCGFPSSVDNGFWNPQCGAPRDCPQGPAFATLVEQNGKWVLLDSWCAGDPAAPQQQPVVTTAALREQVLRLLPTVEIGSAWATRALVNAEAVLWAETSPNRDLGTVTVVGQPVALRIGFDHADWSFGDGSTDTTTDPGKPYRKTDPCGTAQCADYYGHTYRDTGAVTISLTVAWNAQFSLDGGATWTDVDPAPLSGPATTHALDVVQARGILVQNP
jgi:hypothetical protein